MATAAVTVDHMMRRGPVADAVSAAVARLVSSDALNGRYRIGLPIVLATGSCVDVSVWPEDAEGRSFMVSDAGTAFLEVAEVAFSSRTFNKVARERCEAYGATFDGDAMLFMRVSAERLRGSIVAMGSLIKEVVDQTIERALRAKHEPAMELLFDKLRAAYPGREVIHDATVYGASSASYTVDALVDDGQRGVAYEIFSKAPASVNAAFATFSDLSRSTEAPVPVGVTSDLNAIGPKLQLVSSVAKVVRLADSFERFRLAA